MSRMARPTPLRRVITRYVTLKTALGRAYTGEERVLQALAAFVQTTGPSADLTPETFSAWAHTLHHLTPTVRRQRLRLVRNLCLYRRRTEPTCFVPDRALFPAPHQPRTPYIFTMTEIATLLRAARTLPPTLQSPLRPDAFRLAVALLATTGLRCGELRRLTLGDYPPAERVLLIRDTKFHKSRLVPLSRTTAREVDRFLQVRRRHGVPGGATTPLLGHGVTAWRGYTGVGLGQGFRQLLTTAGIKTPEGTWPRIHDLRHTFAVQALVRWYRAGVDVQAKLPLLATYMGHVSIVSTAYYLAFVEPLPALAGARFARHCGTLARVRTAEAEGPR
jgi:integrase